MKLDVDALLPGLLPGSDQPVGQSAFEVPKLSLGKQGKDIEVFDQPLTLGADLSSSAQIEAGSAEIDDPFGSGTSLAAPDGTSFACVQLAADVQIAGEASSTAQGAALHLKATGASGFSYRHLLPVAQDETRLKALTAAVEGVRVPSMVSLAGLVPGESHDATAKLTLGFNADFSAGASTQTALTQALFDGLSAQAEVMASATLSAGLGMALYDTMTFIVGRDTEADSWPRIQLQKTKKRSLSLTSTLQLQVKYDFGSSLITLLENALDQVPIPKLLTTLQETNAILVSGDWHTVQAKLSSEGAQVLNELLDGTGWKSWLNQSPEVADFLAFSNKLVDNYNSLDERVQSLWSQLLGKSDLGTGSKLRQALTQLAGIDPKQVNLLEGLSQNADLNEVLSLVQHLTGETLDDILLDSIPGAQATLGKAVALAQQAVHFLDDTPQAVLSKVEAFAQKAGITQTIQFLATNATSTASIESFVSSRIQTLVSRLVGKAWDQIQASDLQKVQDWAKKLQPILEAPNDLRNELESKIKTTLQKLIGEASFSASLSIDYEASRSALLDVEINPEKTDLMRKVENAMAGGKIWEILGHLVESDQRMVDKDDDKGKAKRAPEELPFRIRQCVFMSRRVRSRSFGLSFKGFGCNFNRQGIVQRIEEARVEVLPERDDDGQLVRQGTYSAGFSRRDVLGPVTNETAIWLESQAQGAGIDFSREYQNQPQPSLRLVFTCEDKFATSAKNQLMSELLEGFGFAPNGVIEQRVMQGFTTQLSVSFHFVDQDGQSLEALVGGTGNASGWNPDFLQAAHAWFRRSVDERFLTAAQNVSWGAFLDAVISTPVFEENWSAGLFPFLNVAAKNWLSVPVATKNGIQRQVPVRWTTERNVAKPNMELGLLYGSLIPKGRRGLAAKQRTLEAWETLETTHNDANYRTLSRRFVNGCLRSAVYGPTWTSSLFILWLTLVRLERRQPDLLPSARGLALLRFRTDDNEEWQEPIRMTLPHGIMPQTA